MEKGQVFAQEENTCFSFFFLWHSSALSSVDPLKSSAASICFELTGRNFPVLWTCQKKTVIVANVFWWLLKWFRINLGSQSLSYLQGINLSPPSHLCWAMYNA